MKKFLCSIVVWHVLSFGMHILAQTSEYVEGELIVLLSPGAEIGRLLANHASIGLRSEEALFDEQLWLLRYDPGLAEVENALLMIQSDPSVEFAQFNHYVTLRGTPDDPRFAEQWTLNNTGQTGGSRTQTSTLLRLGILQQEE